MNTILFAEPWVKDIAVIIKYKNIPQHRAI